MTRHTSIEVRAEFRVGRPRHDVYEFLVDTSHFRRVDPALVDFEPHGRMTAGMRGTMHHRRAGMPARTAWHVADLVPDERLRVEIVGMGYAMSEEVQLDDDVDGTLMRVVDLLEGTSRLGGLFVLVSRRWIERDLAARGDRLRAALVPPG